MTPPKDPSLVIERDGAVASVWFDRPAKHNAFDDTVAAELSEAFATLGTDNSLRAIVLGGRGPSFCAGGDLAWMRRVADYDEAENLADANAFQRAYERIDRCPHPVIARVQGAAMGGGAGLLAVCDVVVAADDVRIGFPEVRLGLVPGVISPYVVKKIGFSHARHLFLTGEGFDAATAHRLGLVHRVVPAAALDDAVARVVGSLLKGAPEGIRAAKRLVFDLVEADADTARALARRAIADARASDDGREGTTAFLAKRKPRWLDAKA